MEEKGDGSLEPSRTELWTASWLLFLVGVTVQSPKLRAVVSLKNGLDLGWWGALALIWGVLRWLGSALAIGASSPEEQFNGPRLQEQLQERGTGSDVPAIVCPGTLLWREDEADSFPRQW